MLLPWILIYLIAICHHCFLVILYGWWIFSTYLFLIFLNYLILSVVLINDKKLVMQRSMLTEIHACQNVVFTVSWWVLGSDVYDYWFTQLRKARLICDLSFLLHPIWKSLFSKADFNYHNFAFYLFSASLVYLFYYVLFFPFDLFIILILLVYLFCSLVFNDIIVLQY